MELHQRMMKKVAVVDKGELSEGRHQVAHSPSDADTRSSISSCFPTLLITMRPCYFSECISVRQEQQHRILQLQKLEGQSLTMLQFLMCTASSKQRSEQGFQFQVCWITDAFLRECVQGNMVKILGSSLP